MGEGDLDASVRCIFGEDGKRKSDDPSRWVEESIGSSLYPPPPPPVGPTCGEPLPFAQPPTLPPVCCTAPKIYRKRT